MRAFFAFLVGVLVAALVIAVVLFALGNAGNARYSLVGHAFTVPIWVPVAVAAAIGFVVALLAVTPARASASRQQALVRGHARQLEHQVAELRGTNATLQTQLTSLQAENERSRAHVEHAESAAAPPSAADEQAQAQPQTEHPLQDERPTMSSAAEAPDATDTAAPQVQPTLGERMRTLFSKPGDPTPTDATYERDATPRRGPLAPWRSAGRGRIR
jgi:TolA-binding protein